jgi:hypothetical protein
MLLVRCWFSAEVLAVVHHCACSTITCAAEGVTANMHALCAARLSEHSMRAPAARSDWPAAASPLDAVHPLLVLQAWTVSSCCVPRARCCLWCYGHGQVEVWLWRVTSFRLLLRRFRLPPRRRHDTAPEHIHNLWWACTSGICCMHGVGLAGRVARPAAAAVLRTVQ